MRETPAPKRKRQARTAIEPVRPSRDSPSLTSMGFLLHLAMRRLSEGIVAALEGTGLHPGHLGVLGALSDRGPMSQRRLCDITRIEKSSMVLFVDALEQSGWLRRVRDPEDRRAHLVELTEAGTARFAALGIGMQAVQDAFLAPLDEGEQAQLVALLTRVAGGAEPERG